MSFAGASSAECSVGRNPLGQLTKHAAEDRSLQRDRFGNSSLSGMTTPAAVANMRLTQGQPISNSDRAMMERFMSPNAGSVLPQDHTPFTYDAMRREVMSIQRHSPVPQNLKRQNSPATFYSDNQWAQELSRAESTEPQSREEWAADFRSQRSMRGGASTNMAPVAHVSQWGYSGNMQMSGMYNSGVMFQQPFSAGVPAFAPELSAQSKGKGRLVELDSADWEAQFNSIESDATTKDDVEQEMKDNARDHYSGETIGESFHGDFENIWRGIQEQHLQDGTATEIGHANNIDATYENLFAGDRFMEMDDSFSTYKNGDELKMPWDKDFEKFSTSRADSGDYQYELENRFMEPDVSDPFAEGVRLIESGGNLSEAALAFEAAVQKDPTHVEAWTLLGTVQAQNEKEDPAIRALERAVQLDADNQTALMSLAVSYINEGYENAAYATLERWIATKYPDLVAQARGQQPQLADVDRFRLHDRVTELFLRAAQISPDGMTMDADVQVGLGVLFYGSEEYDKAVDCFNTALSVRPDDPLLWNRLGATLANSHRSEEAIEAYYKALELRPSFVRARYNLGVSCINIGCYKEAAQHLLTSLEMHRIPNELNANSEDDIIANRSTNLYETLRRVFLAMDRRDLAEKVVNGVDPSVFSDSF